jgi:hypothetical protein
MQTGPILVPAGAVRGITEEGIARALLDKKRARECRLRQAPELANHFRRQPT